MTGLDISPASIAQPADPAQQLPVEGALVAATRALELAKAKADLALLWLQHAARDRGQVFQALGELQDAATAAFTAYNHYDAIRHCAGQA